MTMVLAVAAVAVLSARPAPAGTAIQVGESRAGPIVGDRVAPGIVRRPPESAPERPRRKHWHRHDRDGPWLRFYREDTLPETAPSDPPPPARPPAPPPEAIAPAEPPPPPDPQGPLRLSPARGALPGTERWLLGEALPPDLPHVTLDWRRYDLPEPPPGRIYARVGRSVLLITAGERVVEAVLPPG